MTTHRTRHDGVITSKTRNGSYNIVEKDFGDHRVVYHIPIEYGDDYDVSQFDDMPINDHDVRGNSSPKLTRRRIIQQYEDVDYDDYEYVEEIPVVSPRRRRRIYYSPRPREDPPVIRKIYRPRSPAETVEYIYEDDSSDFYEYRPQPVEQVEYVIEERQPKPIVR